MKCFVRPRGENLSKLWSQAQLRRGTGVSVAAPEGKNTVLPLQTHRQHRVQRILIHYWLRGQTWILWLGLDVVGFEVRQHLPTRSGSKVFSTDGRNGRGRLAHKSPHCTTTVPQTKITTYLLRQLRQGLLCKPSCGLILKVFKRGEVHDVPDCGFPTDRGR